MLMEQADSIREQIKALLMNEDDTSGMRWATGMATGTGAPKRQKAGKQAAAPLEAQLYFVSKTWLTGMCVSLTCEIYCLHPAGNPTIFTDAFTLHSLHTLFTVGGTAPHTAQDGSKGPAPAVCP